MNVENDALFTFKKSFPLVYKTMCVMCINSFIEVVYIWIIAGLVIAGYPWLPHSHFIGPQLQKISANDGKDNCKCANYFTYI